MQHDGMVNGRQYYQCSPAHGLFAAPSKVTKIIEMPTRPVAGVPSHDASNAGSANTSLIQQAMSPAQRDVALQRAALDLEALQAELEFARQESSVLHQEVAEKDVELETMRAAGTPEMKELVGGPWSLHPGCSHAQGSSPWLAASDSPVSEC